MDTQTLQNQIDELKNRVDFLEKENSNLKNYSTIPLDNIRALEGNNFINKPNIWGGSTTILNPAGRVETSIPGNIKDDAIILATANTGSVCAWIGESLVVSGLRVLFIDGTYLSDVTFLLINRDKVTNV